MYRVLKPFNTSNRRFLLGRELAETDLPRDVDLDHMLETGLIERIAEAPPADPPPDAVDLDHDDAVAAE